MFTWVQRINSGGYYAHFNILIDSVVEATGPELTDELLAQVVDFSQAQREGFTEAYINYALRQHPRREHLPEETIKGLKKEYRQRAQSLLKGCAQHFKASVNRIARNDAVIPSNEVEDFQRHIQILVSKDTAVELFEETWQKLLKKWPKTFGWACWWRKPDNEGQAFPAMRKMPRTLDQQIPDTTNPQESLHNYYYETVDRDHDILQGH